MREGWSGQRLSGRKRWTECRSSQDSAASGTPFSSLPEWSHGQKLVCCLTSCPFLSHFPLVGKKLKAQQRDLRASFLGIQWRLHREVPQQKLMLISSLVLAEVSAATCDLECVHGCVCLHETVHTDMDPTVPPLPVHTCHCFCREEEASSLECSCLALC